MGYTHRRDDYEAAPPSAALVTIPLDEDVQADQEKADMGGKLMAQKVEEEQEEEDDEFTLEALVGVAVDPPRSHLLLLDSSSSSHSYKWAEDSADSFRYYQEVDEFYGDHGCDSAYSPHHIKEEATTCSRRSKAVRFSSVHVREYALTVGDHPRCGGVCPMSLSWEYSQRAPASIECYEDGRRIRRRRIDATPFNLDANQRRRRLVSVLGSWDALCRLEMEASRASLQEELDHIFEFDNDGDDNDDDDDLLEEGNADDDIGDCCKFDNEDDASESESELSSDTDSSLFSLSEFPGLGAESLECCMEEDETLVDMISKILAARRRCGNKREQTMTSAPCTATTFASTQQAGASCLLSTSQQRTSSSTRCS